MLRSLFLYFFFCIISLHALDISNTQKNEEFYKARDFSYLLKKTTFDSDLLKLHFNLYRGYVNNTNYFLKKLKQLEKQNQMSSYEYQALKHRFGWEFDGMRLHELYFSNLGNDDKFSKKTELIKALEEQFNNFDDWKKDFIATGMIRGIGWSVLYLDPENNKLINVWINEHNTNHLAGGKPILVMDVWEHAYMPEFGLNRNKYIQTFFENIDWETVNNRYIKAINTK